jgi:hypothetical protein
MCRTCKTHSAYWAEPSSFNIKAEEEATKQKQDLEIGQMEERKSEGTLITSGCRLLN